MAIAQRSDGQWPRQGRYPAEQSDVRADGTTLGGGLLRSAPDRLARRGDTACPSSGLEHRSHLPKLCGKHAIVFSSIAIPVGNAPVHRIDDIGGPRDVARKVGTLLRSSCIAGEWQGRIAGDLGKTKRDVLGVARQRTVILHSCFIFRCKTVVRSYAALCMRCQCPPSRTRRRHIYLFQVAWGGSQR